MQVLPCLLQVAMAGREQISEPLVTGVRAIDALTPFGRGASLLVIGPKGAGGEAVGEDAILGQRGAGERVSGGAG